MRESLLNQFKNTTQRIKLTHYVVIFLLVLSTLFFTENLSAIAINIVLIIAVFIHDKDDNLLKKKLEESQQKLREDTSIFDRNVIVSESDLDGTITYVNSKFCKISGYSKEELIGKSHNIMRSEKVPDDFYKELWETIEAGKTFHGKFQNIKKDGTVFWVDASISPIKKDNKTVGYKAIRFDITEQINAEVGLKNKIDEKEVLLEVQSNRFEFAINSSRDGFWDYDLQSKKFYLSSGWKKRLGFKENDELRYLDYLALIPDEYRFEHHNAMHSLIEEYPKDNNLEYVHFRVQYPLVTKNGEKLKIEDVGDAFFDPKDKMLVRITGFHRDITEQERQNKIIESQNRVSAMGEMIGNIAHQWRQPIGAINNTLNDLEFDIELEDLKEIDIEQVLATTKKVKEYTAHMSQTIDDFRTLSSDEKVKSNFYLIEVLEEAKSIVEHEYAKAKLSLEIDKGGECNCEFIGYRRELLQVVLNILNNAKDVLVEKSIDNPRVELKIYKDENSANISIYDNAGGVPDAIIEKIFDPYFTTKHESIGTGIGLYMSKKIIQEHFNGTLSVENIKNGANFVISLPIPNEESLSY